MLQRECVHISLRDFCLFFSSRCLLLASMAMSKSPEENQVCLQKRSPANLDYSTGLPLSDFKRLMRHYGDLSNNPGALKSDREMHYWLINKYIHYHAKVHAMKDVNPDRAKALLDKHRRKIGDTTIREEKRRRQPSKAQAWEQHIESDDWKYTSREHQRQVTGY